MIPVIIFLYSIKISVNYLPFIGSGKIINKLIILTILDLLKDKAYPLFITLNYMTTDGLDVIEAWTEIRHSEKKNVTLTKFASAQLPVRRGNVWISHLYGSWANEGRVSQEPLTPDMKDEHLHNAIYR